VKPRYTSEKEEAHNAHGQNDHGEKYGQSGQYRLLLHHTQILGQGVTSKLQAFALGPFELTARVNARASLMAEMLDVRALSPD
jgi:hypothetical protein